MNFGIRKKLKFWLMGFFLVGFVAFGIYKADFISRADTTGLVNTVSGNLTVRSGPGTSYGKIGSLPKGTIVTVVEDTGNKWYRIKSGTVDGYVSADFILITDNGSAAPPDGIFEAQLEAEQFPEHYRTYLRALHQKHPNWQFKAFHTGLEWKSVIAGQTNITSRNLVPKSSVNSWKSLAPGAYDWDNNSWYEYEKGWVSASTEVIQYFMDPRNFLVSDSSVLQFQSLRWTGLENTSGVSNILAGTAMGSSGENFPQYFVDAGSLNNISAYHLGTRAVQETAGGTSGSVTGQYKNYFNIRATGPNPVQAAVQYAKTQGWDTAEKSIKGGAVFIANNYVNRGQDSLYLQKFDVVDNEDGLFSHQYMQNLQAPVSESSRLGKAYQDLANSSVLFTVPVYKNMPATACLKPSSNGNPNNLLSSLSVNGFSLTPFFNKFNENYTVIVPQDVSSVIINATPVLDGTRVSGAGTVNLNEGITTVKITVTPGYGPARIYSLDIARSGNTSGGDDGSGSDEKPGGGNPGGGNGAITSSYQISDAGITGIPPGTDAQAVAADIKAEGRTVSIVTADGNPKSGPAATGDIVRISNGGTIEKEYTVIIRGDLNGDGQINFSDVTGLQRNNVGIKVLNGAFLAAGDTNRDGRVDFSDLLNLQRHIVGIKNISQ